MKFAAPIALFVAVQFVISAAAADAPTVTQAEAIAAFEQGKGLLEAGKVDEAIKELELGTQSVEKEVLARANLARAYFAKGETQQANKAVADAVFVGGQRIRKAVTDNTISAQLYVDRGFAWLVNQEVLRDELAKEDNPYDGDALLQTATEDLEHAIELDPECFHAYRLLASARLSLREYGKSIEACDKAIALQPNCLDLYSYKAQACLESQTESGFGELMVRSLFKLCEEERIPEKQARTSLKDAVGSQAWEEAVAACNTALEIEPQNGEFLLLRARAYVLGGEYDKPLVDCNKVIELEPENASAYLFRGELLIQSNNLCEALEDYERATRLDRRSIAQPRWVACLAILQQKFDSVPEDKVMVLVERICAAAPEIGEVYLLRSLFNRVYEHQDAAEKEYKRAFEVGLSQASREFFKKPEQ